MIANQFRVIALVVGLTFPHFANAQTLTAAKPFDENLVGSGPSRSFSVAGRILVGLSVGHETEDARVNLNSQKVVLAPSQSGEFLCTWFSTLDGRYSARSVQGVLGSVLTKPPLGLPSKHASELDKYHPSQLLIRAQQGESCESGSQGKIVPAYYPSAPEILHVSLDIGRSSPNVKLRPSSQNVTVGDFEKCTKSVHATRTHECIIDISNITSGDYDLIVEIKKLGRGIDEKIYKIFLP